MMFAGSGRIRAGAGLLLAAHWGSAAAGALTGAWPAWAAFAATGLLGLVLWARGSRSTADPGVRSPAGEVLFRQIADRAPVGIFMADAAGKSLYANERLALMTGYPADQGLGDGWAQFIHPQDRERVVKDWAAAAAAGVEFESEFRFRRPSTETVWVACRAVPCRDSAGQVTGHIGVVVNVTERRRVQEMKGEFVSTVSHELRTPLTAIHGSLRLLASGKLGNFPQTARSMIDIAAQSCERLSLLVNDILDMEKIEAGRMSMTRVPVGIGSLVEQAVASNRPYADVFGVGLASASTVNGDRVIGDPNRLLQVLSNLVSNAVKYSPRGETVTVSVDHGPMGIRVSVADRGPGIPAEFRSRVFQKFAQADGTEVKAVKGTGLGLPIAKAIVEQLGGEMGFETETGKGTTFYFDLPNGLNPFAGAAKSS
jgi:PAS domain S-box-containing protein